MARVPLCTAALAAGFLLAASASGQAWTQEPGRAYVKLSLQDTRASEQYREDGSRAPYAAGLEANGYEDRSLYLYAEYGLSARSTLVLLLPMKRITVRTPHPQASSGLPGTDRPIERSADRIQNVAVGWRYDLTGAFDLPTNGRHRTALNTTVRIPTGYDREGRPAVGPGQVDVEAMLHYGLSLWPAPFYTQMGAGFRARTSLYRLSSGDAATPDYGNEWLLHGEAGLSVGPLLLQGLLFGTFSNQQPETGFDPANPVPTRQRYLKTGVGLTAYPVRSIGISVQVFATPTGANTVRSTDWFFGVESRF